MRRIMSAYLGVGTMLLLIGCQNHSDVSYHDTLIQKNEANTYHYQVSLDYHAPDDLELDGTRFAGDISQVLEEIQLGYEVKGDKEQETYELTQEFPWSAAHFTFSHPMEVTNALLENDTLFVKVEELIAFNNEHNNYGFELPVTTEIEGKYVGMPLGPLVYTPDDLLFFENQYEEFIDEMEISHEEDGLYSFSVDGSEAEEYFIELIKRTLAYSFPGLVELTNQEFDNQVEIGDVQVDATVENGVLTKEDFHINLSENDRNWEVFITIDYLDLDYSGDIDEPANHELLNQEEYQDYIRANQP